jgi:hypothetical protein
MIKRRGRSQIGNLSPKHKPLESKGQMSFDWGVLYTVGKIILKDIGHYPHIFKTNLIWKKYECPKFWNNKGPNFGIPIWKTWEKMIGCSPRRKAQNIIWGEWCFFPKVASPPIPKVLWIKERAPIFFFFYCFALGPPFGSLKEFGGVSQKNI